MICTAKVISVSGELAEIEVRRKSMCDGCEKSSCAVGGLMGNGGTMRTRALNKAGAMPGDTVEIESSNGRVLSLALLVFILPVVVGILFYYAAAAVGLGSVISALSAAGGLVLSFIGIGIAERVHRAKKPDITVVSIACHGSQ